VITAVNLVSRIKSLPPLSTTVVHLMEVLKRDDTTPAQLERLVNQDPALTANLLRIANSAYYRGTRPVPSARAAIVRLGSRGVYEIAVGLSFRKTLPTRIPGYEIESEAFIRHGVAVGVLTERLAREVRGVDRDVAFTMGLLHDLGKLVVGVFLAEEKQRANAFLLDQNVSFEEMEAEILGTDHCEVGHEIARQWRLPAEVAIAARWHHSPMAAPDPGAQRLASLVHVADAMAHLFGYGEDAGDMRRRVDGAVPDLLGLSEDQLAAIAGSTVESIDEFARALNSATA